MKYITFLLIFFLNIIKISISQIVSSSFHTLFTFIHNDPCILENIFKLNIPEYVKKYCNDLNEINYIQIMENLDYSSFIHIERMIDEDCPFSHNTCSSYCYIYDNSCNFYDRIKYYLSPDKEIKKIGEVLVKDDSIEPLKAITHFINSENHAKIILDKNFNYYGISHYQNIFNMNFLESNIIEQSNNSTLETIFIFHDNKKYILTTQELCNENNILVYSNSGMMIYV